MGKLTKEQLKQVKEQLDRQIQTLPLDQQQEVFSQINEMTDDELEDFLIKNKMLSQTSKESSPFRMIVSGNLPSYKLAENDKAIAVLEINPVSKGHTILIPKIAASTEKEIEKEIKDSSNKLKDYLLTKLGAKKIDITISEIFDEAIINLIPVYTDENINSTRKKASESELKQLEKDLQFDENKIPSIKEVKEVMSKQKEKPVKEKKKRKASLKKLPQAPRRIP